MPAKGDEVAEKIEAQVREAIGKMVSDMRSSVEDVRDAVVQQLQAAMQSVQADANALSLRSQIQQSLRGLAEPAAAAAPARAPAAADVSSLKRAIQSVERGTSQIDVLNSLLDQSLNFGSRAALLILKGDVFSGWKATGFSTHGGNDENVKRFSASASSVPELDRLLRQEKVVAWNGASLTSRFAASPAQQAVIIPMVIKDKVAAALYVDSFDAAKFNRGALELLVFTTGLLIDTLTIRKKIPSPTLSSEETDATVVVSEVEPFADATVVMEPEPPPPPRPVPPRPAPARPAAPPPPAQPRPTRQFEVESEASAARRPAAAPADSFATTAIPAFTPPPPPRPAAPPQPPAPSVADLSERSTTQYIPPAGVKGGARFGQPTTEDVKKHDEARRFARLLVSEIKLYNESKVDQGRKHKDIYERLKEDIDRSRQMYDERVPENVRKSSNYFYDELVRILADGDADALGL